MAKSLEDLIVRVPSGVGLPHFGKTGIGSAELKQHGMPPATGGGDGVMARQLDTLLAQWLARRGLAPVAPGEEGKHYYVFDGDYEVALSQVGPRIYFETQLQPMPAQREKAEALLTWLMKLQLARARRAAEVLSLTPEGDGLILFRVISAARVDIRQFETALGSFVNTAAFWLSKLEESGPPFSSATAPPMQIMYP